MQEFKIIEIQPGRVITNRNPLNEEEETILHSAAQDAMMMKMFENDELNVVYPEQEESK